MNKLLLGLLCLGLPASLPAEAPADPARTAVEKGLRRLEQGSANYVENRQCFSCHHQALTIIALRKARERGFKVATDALRTQIDFTLKTFRPNREQILKGRAVPGGNTTAAYALYALINGGHKADDVTSALVKYLLLHQRDDGSWPAQGKRPPSEGSSFTNTALALHALKLYGPAPDATDAEKLRQGIDAAFRKGREWLLRNKPETTEDKMFHLRGLVNASAEKIAIDAARDLLLKEQRADGSWSQLPDKEGDAYATGAVLLSLRQAGVKTTDDVYRKGTQYLLKTQKEDGSWFVATRSRPVQVFFDNGDPGGKSQFISFAATGWAVLALLEMY